MTNSEKYLKDGVDVEKFVKDIFNPINKATNTTFEYTPYINSKELKKYLKKEIKPTLTGDERAILRNLHEEYKHIKRNEMGNLYIGVDYFGMYDNLFQFIKNGEEYIIEELLKDD